MKIVKKVERASEIRGDITKDISASILKSEKFKILIDGTMSIGKTYLINELQETYKNSGLINILVAPTQLLCEQVSKKYPSFELVIAKMDYNNSKTVVTTPDSLPKIIEKIGNIPFILYVDEAHKIISDSGYRKAYKNIDKYKQHENCLGEIYTTATPHNIKEFFKFTKIYDLRGKNRVVDEFELLVVPRLDYSTKKAVLNRYKDCEEQIIYYNNNVKELEKLDKLLNNEYRISKETLIHEKVKVKNDYLCSKNKKLSSVAIELTENSTIPKDLDYFGFTSAGDAGVEIYSENICNFVAFADRNTFNYVNEIQATGRPRTKVNKLTVVIEESEPVDFIPSWKKFREYELSKAKDEYNRNISAYNLIKDTGFLEGIIHSLSNYNYKQGYINSYEHVDGKIIVNESKLENLMWNNYCKLLLTRPDILLNKFINDKVITANKYSIVKFEDELNSDDRKRIKEQLEEDVEKELARSKSCDMYMEQLSNLDDEIIVKLFDKELDQEQYKEEYKKLSLIKDIKKSRYLSIKNIRRFDILSDVELIKMFLDEKVTNKEINKIESMENIKIYYRLYEDNTIKDTLMVSNKSKATEYYLIRKFFENDKGKLKRDRLSDKKISKLFDYLKENKNIDKKKEYSEAENKKLLNTLNLIFNTSDNKITSVKK